MPFKKMTLREQRTAKRELRRLRALEADIRSDWSGTRIAEGTLCAQAGGAIDAAMRLGYVILVRRANGGAENQFKAIAYRLGGPAK